jgi:hypothetical protein
VLETYSSWSWVVKASELVLIDVLRLTAVAWFSEKRLAAENGKGKPKVGNGTPTGIQAENLQQAKRFQSMKSVSFRVET